MSRKYKVAVVVGSLRTESINRKAAQALVRLAPQNFECEFVEIGDLPLYDEDVETVGVPAPWSRFREEISLADGVFLLLLNTIVRYRACSRMPSMWAHARRARASGQKNLPP